MPSLPVIHDINFVHRPKDLPLMVRKYYNYYFPKYAKKASRIATVSNYSKNDISKSFIIDPGKIDVVYNGANEMYRPVSERDKQLTKRKYSDGADYFVFIGAFHPRKNLVGLLKAYEMFRSESQKPVKLVLVVAKMSGTAEMYKFHSSMKFRDDVVFTGRLQPGDLCMVLGSALSLVFVPFFEGFGIPVVEAMYCNVPVIASNVTSLPEVGGDACLYADPHQPSDIKKAMTRIAHDETLRKDLIKKANLRRQKFSWDNTAKALWQSVEKTLE